MAPLHCNACFSVVDTQYVLTDCNHVYCIDDAKQILRADDSTCPRCDNIITNRKVRVINRHEDPFDEGCLMGCTPKQMAKSMYLAIDFAEKQSHLVSEARQEKLQAKGDQEREQMMAKLTELHAAYKKTKARMLQLSQEQEAMQRDNAELQSKMSEKTRQKRKLEEMFESLSHENEELKQRCRQGGGGGVRAMPPPTPSTWQAQGMGRSSAMPHALPSSSHRDRELASSRAPSRQAGAALLDDGGGGAYYRNPPNSFGGGGGGGGGGREFASHILFSNDERVRGGGGGGGAFGIHTSFSPPHKSHRTGANRSNSGGHSGGHSGGAAGKLSSDVLTLDRSFRPASRALGYDGLGISRGSL